jgi:hypothetical protein
LHAPRRLSLKTPSMALRYGARKRHAETSPPLFAKRQAATVAASPGRAAQQHCVGLCYRKRFVGVAAVHHAHHKHGGGPDSVVRRWGLRSYAQSSGEGVQNTSVVTAMLLQVALEWANLVVRLGDEPLGGGAVHTIMRFQVHRQIIIADVQSRGRRCFSVSTHQSSTARRWSQHGHCLRRWW